MKAQPPAVPQSIGEALRARGVLSEDQLRIALQEQGRRRQDAKPLGSLLVEFGFISENVLRDALAERLGMLSADLSQLVIDAAVLQMIPRELALRLGCMPLAWDGETATLLLASAHPDNLLALDQIRECLPPGAKISLQIAGEAAIAAAIDRHYGHQLSIEALLHEVEGANRKITFAAPSTPLAPAASAQEQPVIRLLDAIFADAVKQGASDIHFEPEAGFLRIRYRLDGVLRHIRSLHGNAWSAMAVRLKVLCAMNIAETRAPQDGRLELNVSGRLVDCRVSAQPTLHGENIVLRILDRHKGILALSALGLEDGQLHTLERLMTRPEGMLLISGPTGSGKTTTLYSLLQHINNESINIMTLEDPVEFPLPVVRQTSLSSHLKIDFATGIRSLLRQDPDVILVGEIRDQETARMALRAAMTGHQLFSTLHSNSALGSIPRLLDLGMSPDMLAANLNGLIAQRLLRRLCPHCKEAYPASGDDIRRLGLQPTHPPVSLYKPKGCAACAQQGYKGRFAIMEVLAISPQLEAEITQAAPLFALRNTAQAEGLRTLAMVGSTRVLAGDTSLAELARVVYLEAATRHD